VPIFVAASTGAQLYSHRRHCLRTMYLAYDKTPSALKGYTVKKTRKQLLTVLFLQTSMQDCVDYFMKKISVSENSIHF